VGLRDVSLSRPSLKWGVPVPWDPDQVIYVWFDALLNYYTALGYARKRDDLTRKFWPAFHILAKDILKFHAVYWPAFLMAAGLEVPRGMYIHGYLLMKGQKMSKSLGNVLDPDEVIEKFGADALRYYCMREVSFGQDGHISPAGFEARYEAELANEYGNLANRTLSMIERYRDGVVPDAGAESALVKAFEGVPLRVRELLQKAELTQALEEIWKLVRRLNQYVEETKPWDLAKDEKDRDRLDGVLYDRGAPRHHAAASRLHARYDRPPARGARRAAAPAGRVLLAAGRAEARGARAPFPQARDALGFAW
jgi:methionyl-tRNA synthetase